MQCWQQTVTRGQTLSSHIIPWARTSASHHTGPSSLRAAWTTRGPTISTSSWWWRRTVEMSLTRAPPQFVCGWPTSTMKPLSFHSLCEYICYLSLSSGGYISPSHCHIVFFFSVCLRCFGHVNTFHPLWLLPLYTKIFKKFTFDFIKTFLYPTRLLHHRYICHYITYYRTVFLVHLNNIW